MFAVLDTNHFRELRESSPIGQRLNARIEALNASVFSCIVAVEESLQGRIAFIRSKRSGRDQVEGYRRLQTTINALTHITILPFDDDAAMVFHDLEKLRLRVGTMDLKISSICLVHDAMLLTRNLSDFEKIPGLKVENWLD
jgi:tRNA(fMet)-specific endonuclease VapC